MKIVHVFFIIVSSLWMLGFSLGASEFDKTIHVRVAAYNVEFGRSTTPEEVGKMFKPYNLDIIGFNEVPDGDWTARVGKILGMKHSYVGKISSANHKDKYKSILSRTPFEATAEHELSVKRKRSWNPASVVQAVTKIDGAEVAIYSLHVCRSTDSHRMGHAYRLTNEVLPKEKTDRVIVLGDFNNNMGDTAMNMLEESGFRPTWKDLEIDVSKEFTYNALKPEQPNAGVIDHIFYNTGSKAITKSGGIIELKKPLSDHKPVWADISFPKSLKKIEAKKLK
jgi:endonuclease/exonuclease/phosphatase family metal-dependent hydrolase